MATGFFYEANSNPYGIVSNSAAANLISKTFAGITAGGAFLASTGRQWVYGSNLCSSIDGWESLSGPSSGGYTIISMTESPSGHLFYLTDGYTVMRSTDGGANWVSRSTLSTVVLGLSSVAWYALLASNTGRLVAAGYGVDGTTWDSVTTYSDDGGATWSTVVRVDLTGCTNLFLAPNNRIIGYGFRDSVFYSDDDAVSWTVALNIAAFGGTPWPTEAFAAYYDEAVASAALLRIVRGFIATTATRRAYRSVDNGATWTLVSTWNSATANVVSSMSEVTNGLIVALYNGGLYVALTNNVASMGTYSLTAEASTASLFDIPRKRITLFATDVVRYNTGSVDIDTISEPKGASKNSAVFGGTTGRYLGPSSDDVSDNFASYDSPSLYTYMEPAIGPSALALYIPLGQTTGTTTVSGCTAVAGRVGNCYSFDGSDDYISLGNGADLKPTTQLSIVFWAKPAASQVQYATIVSCHSNGFTIEQNSTNTNQYSFAFSYGAGTFRATSYFTLTANVWSHVACTWNGSTLTVYVNGVSVATGSGGGPIYYDSTDVMLGRWASGGGRFWSGCLEQFGIYRKALTAGEILLLASGATYPFKGANIAQVPARMGYRPAPSFSNALQFTTVGTWYIWRQSDEKIYTRNPAGTNTSYVASTFGTTVAPRVMMVRVQGGGAGGGNANGSQSGTGGGGGGAVVAWVAIPLATSYSGGISCVVGNYSNGGSQSAGGTSSITIPSAGGGGAISAYGGGASTNAVNLAPGGVGGSYSITAGALGSFAAYQGGDGGPEADAAYGENVVVSAFKYSPEDTTYSWTNAGGTYYSGTGAGGGGASMYGVGGDGATALGKSGSVPASGYGGGGGGGAAKIFDGGGGARGAQGWICFTY